MLWVFLGGSLSIPCIGPLIFFEPDLHVNFALIRGRTKSSKRTERTKANTGSGMSKLDKTIMIGVTIPHTYIGNEHKGV